MIARKGGTTAGDRRCWHGFGGKEELSPVLQQNVSRPSPTLERDRGKHCPGQPDRRPQLHTGRVSALYPVSVKGEPHAEPPGL